MSNVTENPNDKQSPGKPLGPDEVAPTENNGVDDGDVDNAPVGGLAETRKSDDGLGSVNEDEDQPGLPEEKRAKQSIEEAGMRS